MKTLLREKYARTLCFFAVIALIADLAEYWTTYTVLKMTTTLSMIIHMILVNKENNSKYNIYLIISLMCFLCMDFVILLPDQFSNSLLFFCSGLLFLYFAIISAQDYILNAKILTFVLLVVAICLNMLHSFQVKIDVFMVLTTGFLGLLLWQSAAVFIENRTMGSLYILIGVVMLILASILRSGMEYIYSNSVLSVLVLTCYWSGLYMFLYYASRSKTQLESKLEFE